MRCALISDTAAWTACSSASSGGRGRGAGAVVGGRRAAAAAAAAGAGGCGASAELGAEVLEDRLVEAVLALQVGLDDLEELAGLGALDDAMVVRRRHRHHLLGADHLRRSRRGRAGSRSSRWRRSCPGRSSAAGTEAIVPIPPGLVSETLAPWRSSAVSLFSRARAIRSLKAPRKPEKLRRPASRMTGTISVRAAVLLLDVDRDAEVDRAVVDAVRLAVDLGEVVGHHRHLLGGGARDRVGDQVGEGDLAGRRP